MSNLEGIPRRCSRCGVGGVTGKEFFRGKKNYWCKPCYREYKRGRTADQKKHAQLRTDYGIGLDDYNQMIKDQSGVCAICSGPPKGKRPLVVDHSHKTGRVRALLCHRCNLGLAYMETEWFEPASAYLRKYA